MKYVSRRKWLAACLKAAAGFTFKGFFPLKTVHAFLLRGAHSGGKGRIGQVFEGETMTFIAGFLWFTHAGDATLTFQRLPGKGRYRATLSGQTRGFIGFFTRHRKDTHISELVENREGTRFICKRLIRDTKIGNSHTIKIFDMDYHNHLLTITRIKGHRESRHQKPIPEDIFYDDPVTAFYNFRYCSYGPVTYGSHFVIHTIPGKRANHLYLHVASREKTLKMLENSSYPEKTKYLVSLRIAPDIVRSKKGELEGCLTKSLIPLCGVAKDVIFFGDVRGKLVKRYFKVFPLPPL
jgi:hypothetical protein